MAYFGGATLSFVPGSTYSSTNQVLKLLTESVAPTAPLIALDQTEFVRTVDLGENLAGDTFAVSNGGSGTLAYGISHDAPTGGWLSVAPVSGSSTGEADTITISYTTAGLAVGTYNATISVFDDGSIPAATNSPQTINVTVTVKSVLPDFDSDGDVDVTDFGHLQTCLSEPGRIDTPECADTDMTGDGLIDGLDIGLFIDCLSGAGVPANKSCDDLYE